MYGAVPPLGVSGEKLGMTVPTCRLCVAVFATAPSAAGGVTPGDPPPWPGSGFEIGGGLGSGLAELPPPPHAVNSTLERNTANMRQTSLEIVWVFMRLTGCWSFSKPVSPPRCVT